MEDWSLKQTRKRLGLSQAQLARLLEVATQTISHWETDHQSPPPFLYRAMRDIELELKLKLKLKGTTNS